MPTKRATKKPPLKRALPSRQIIEEKPRRSTRRLSWVVFAFALGILIGGWLFVDVQPRSFLAIRSCDNCLAPNDLAGLFAAVGLAHIGTWTPFVIRQTPYTVVIRNPFPDTRVDYVVLPKKDIKDVGHLSRDDQAYLVDAFAVMSDLIREHHLVTYQVLTNGPGWQKMTYLHFHLMAWDGD